ncbi:MAG: hypothetical protein QG619_1734, partial [Pseudomonadota bacterium]|nr:hypothetical protein [Pseudomonadota bacterium]
MACVGLCLGKRFVQPLPDMFGLPFTRPTKFHVGRQLSPFDHLFQLSQADAQQ